MNKSPASPRLLLVAPPEETVDSLISLLQSQAYGVEWVTSAYRLEETLAQGAPALALLAHPLDLDSFSLCQVLGEREPPIPVVFLLSAVSPEILTRLYQAGAADYLTAPYHPAEVLARIDQQLVLEQLRHSLAAKERQLGQILTDAQELESNLNRVNQELRRASASDPLTGLPNRPRLEEVLEQQWRRSTRERILWGDGAQATLSLILVKLDQFEARHKFWSEADNSFLLHLAATIQHTVHRPGDFVAYFGDGIVALMLPNTPQAGAMKVLERLRRDLSPSALGASELITFSFGVVSAIPSQGLSGESLLQAALETLLTALAEGTEQVAIDQF
ncbi:MAG: GGDEF domain-containing protein [Cyanobacteriota bacterium]|jgi:diguanylate cyclase (GGDEF)-like protein